MSQPLRTNRYETIGQHETLSVELPDGIGMVRIRTGEKDARTGYPRIAIEVVSDSLDTPADDGRYYASRFDQMQDTVYLVGHPDTKET
jgi:hypothetical protein